MSTFRLAVAFFLAIVIVPLSSAIVQAAVDLESFSGSWSGSAVTLNFSTGSQVNHAEFNVWRATSNVNPSDVASSGEKINATPIRNGPCTISGQNYTFPDPSVQTSVGTYYYYLESTSCDSGGSQFYGSLSGSGGLAINNPSAPPATNTPTSNSTPNPNATGTQTANTPTPQPTTRPGQPTNTPGPTGTLIPIASPTTAAAASATARPTNTTAPNAPTQAPVPTQAQPPTEAPVPTDAPTDTTPPTQAPIATAATEATPLTVPDANATETPAPIAAAASPMATTEAIGGDMSSNQPAPTPTVSGGLPSAEQGSGLDSGANDPLVAASGDEGGIDGVIQGLIGVILVGVVGLVGFIGWNYMRSRQQ